MKIALAAVGFITNDIAYNLSKIEEVVKKYRDKADMILFGESFIQGFDCLSWDYSRDIDIALGKDSKSIKRIRSICKEYDTALSVGYIEKYKDRIYSSQITLDKNGEILNNFRRVSKGWKESIADDHYSEGDSFIKFEYMGKVLSIGLCGDLWYEENCRKMKKLDLDLVFWSVYTDFNYEEWNKNLKYEYADQAKKFCDQVLYVNSYCIDGASDDIARGGAAFFKDGQIKAEIPSGKEGVLVIEV